MKIKWFYKGIRIHKWNRYILWNTGLILVIAPVLAMIGFNLLSAGIKEYNWLLLVKNVGLGLLISGSLIFLLLPLLRRLYDMQKLCQMIYSALYFGTKRQEGEQIDSSQEALAYFPAVYYRRLKEKRVQVCIKLDGNKHHLDFMRMENILGHMFDMQCVEKCRRLWYVIYVFEDIVPKRIWMGKGVIEYSDNQIPIMKGLNWNFDAAPHALVTGGVGGGKTFFLLYLIRSLLAMGADIKIIDPKRSDLYGLRSILGDSEVVYAPGGVIPILRECVKEMDRRYEQMGEKGKFGALYKEYGITPCFIVFDEFVAFAESLQDKKDSRSVHDCLMQIILKGRQAGMYLIMATQRADAEYLDGAIRDNLGLRVSLGVLEREGYRMTFGAVDMDFEKFESGHGYIYINGTTRSVREFYSPQLGEGYDPYNDLRVIMQGHGSGALLRSASRSDKEPGTCGSEASEEGEKNA